MNNVQDEYAKSFAEVYTIINLMTEELKTKIPEKFKKFIIEEKSEEYNPSIEFPIDDSKLLPATIVIMGMIYRDFFVSDDEKLKLLKKDKSELEEYENRLKQIYSVDKLFHNKEKIEEKNELSIMEYKKNTLFYKIKKLIKKFWNLMSRK